MKNRMGIDISHKEIETEFISHSISYGTSCDYIVPLPIQEVKNLSFASCLLKTEYIPPARLLLGLTPISGNTITTASHNAFRNGNIVSSVGYVLRIQTSGNTQHSFPLPVWAWCHQSTAAVVVCWEHETFMINRQRILLHRQDEWNEALNSIYQLSFRKLVLKTWKLHHPENPVEHLDEWLNEWQTVCIPIFLYLNCRSPIINFHHQTHFNVKKIEHFRILYLYIPISKFRAEKWGKGSAEKELRWWWYKFSKWIFTPQTVRIMFLLIEMRWRVGGGPFMTIQTKRIKSILTIFSFFSWIFSASHHLIQFQMYGMHSLALIEWTRYFIGLKI